MKEINGRSTKQEEINLLKDMAATYIKNQTYLSDFFTDELFTWIEQQIKIDFPPDIISRINELERINLENGYKITNLKKQIEQLANLNTYYENKYTEITNTYNQLKHQLRQLV